MQSTLSEQIQGIMKARLLVIKEATSPNTSEDLRKALNEVSVLLNDAGSTIASLNLTKELPQERELLKEVTQRLKFILIHGVGVLVDDLIWVEKAEVFLSNQQSL